MFERVAAMYVWNVAALIGVPLHFSFAPPSQGRSSIIVCGAIIEALMAAACEAVPDPPVFLSVFLDGSEDRTAGAMRLDHGRIEVQYEWRVRRAPQYAVLISNEFAFAAMR